MKTKFLFAVVFALSSLFAKSQIAVLYPNDGGDTLFTGQYATILWNGSLDSTKHVNIELYSSISLSWILLDSFSDIGSISFYLDHVPTQTAKIRITRLDSPIVTDESDGFFHIIKSPIVVSAGANDTMCLNEVRRLQGSIITSGIGPLTIKWSPSTGLNDSTMIKPLANPTSTTTYTLTVKDAVGDSGTAQVTIFVKPNLAPTIDSIITTDLTCANIPTGSACAFVSGGTPPYTYDWRDSSTSSSCVSNRYAGSVNLEVIDAVGCSVIDTVSGYITQPDPLFIQFTYLGNGVFPDTLQANVVVGGVPPFSYNWGPPIGTQSSIEVLSYGLYQITVTDGNNCSVASSYNLFPIQAKNDTVYFCYSSAVDSQLWIKPINNDAFTQGDYLTMDSIWGLPPGITATVLCDTCAIILKGMQTYKSFFSFSYLIRSHLTVNTAIGEVTVLNYNQCVWPGDANYDGVVDNFDMLPIGQGYGTVGFERPFYFAYGINWQDNVSIDWIDTLPDGVNYKHIDCDGNGTINANDTLAIIQNYNLTHPRSGGVKTHRANTPELSITLDTDTLADGQTVVASLSLGSSAQPANDVYGIAFTFNYDANVVDTTQVGFVVNDNSWLCNNAGDHISINKKFYDGGKIAVGITRIDKATRSGSGEIATAILKITTGNINGKDLSYYKLNTYISDVRAVDSAGNIMDINEGFDSAAVAFTPTGIHEVSVEQNKVLLYPNPASNSIRFSLQNGAMESWEIVSAEGRIVVSEIIKNSAPKTHLADVSGLAKGVYFLKVNTKAGAVHGRFLKE